MTADAQEDLIELYAQSIDKTNKDTYIREGSLIPKNDAMKAMLRTMDKSAYLSWHNFDLQSLTQQLGGAFKKVHEMGLRAASKQGELRMKMLNALEKGMKGITLADRIALEGKQKVNLETRVDGDAVGRTDLDMDGFHRLKLTAMSRDGRNKSNNELTDYSGARTLSTSTGGFVMKGMDEPIVLTPKQVDEIAKGSLLNKKEMQMLEALEAGYQSIVKDANIEGNSLIAKDVFNTKNQFYSPKRTVDVNDTLTDSKSMYDSMFDPSNKERGAIMERTGIKPVELTNPFDEFNFYKESMSKTLSHMRYNKSLEVLLSGRPERILRNEIGDKAVNAMKDLLAISKQDKAKVTGKADQGFLDKLFALRQLGILSSNASAALKQTGSGLSAIATGKLDPSWNIKLTGHIFKNAFSKKKLDAKIEAMRKELPSFDSRLAHSARVFDVDEFSSSMSHIMAGRDKLSMKEIAEMAKKSNVKLSDSALSAIEKGMFAIEHMDKATMAAVWDAAKDTADKAFKRGDLDFKKKYGNNIKEAREMLFNDIMMESQPTRMDTTLSINQRRTDFGSRMLTQFSTQVRHNADLAYRGLLQFINSERKPEDVALFASRIVPLAVQAGMITSMGYAGSGLTNTIAEQFESKSAQRKRERMEAKRLKETGRIVPVLRDYLKSIFGQAPMLTGPAANSLIDAATGSPVYDLIPPVIGEIIGAAQGATDIVAGKNGWDDVIKNTGRLFGMPAVFTKSAAAATR